MHSTTVRFPGLVRALALTGTMMAATLAQAQDAAIPMPRPTEEQAAGLEAGDWLVRARIAGLFPVDETSSVGLIGGRIETPDMILPDLQIAYFLTDRISVEGQAGVVRTRPRIVGSIIGEFEIGTIWSAAVSGSIQYHFLPDQRLNPYVGIGASYSHPISTKPARGVSDFDVKAQTSLLIQAGADYRISGDWFGNAVARYLVVPEQVYQGGGASFESDADMVFVGAGIGYRF
ncbi:OmpW family outer membrane protein [Fulvimarina sp. 2208YS6-2-32]|uniref:OmpW family outer membrane protein n=1 Tax=Fulvimarina uroteuthidis TaxID=3098149 RepID=A0ABU5HWK3_9HYPH|nr:OmpW family outer membrane protein [Fulvimarina sp. 2208YS6-2-32]MDY8107536.1 OmpW family outer membrane protein [Fulvimarina sp. 2208YS6-2-32]